MSILLLEAMDIQKSFGDKPLLEIKALRIYSGDRIGFVGANGSGKTTLLSILSGEMNPDEGWVQRYCDIAYIRQFAPQEQAVPISQDAARKLSEYGVAEKAKRAEVSGGEATRLKIALALNEERRLVFADEPTSNLDMEGIARFGEELSTLESFILISHDRDLLNQHCNKIMTLENRALVLYEGSYDAYEHQQSLKKERALAEYAQYTDEKERLHKVYSEKKAKATKVSKKPKGMSSSEMKQRDFIATSRSNDGRQRGFERAAKAVQARIDHMEVKERPQETLRMKLDFKLTEPPANKTIIIGKDINYRYGSLTIFQQASFTVSNGARVALCGANGSGKTTLLNLIHQGDDCIYTVPKARIGYFYQGFSQLDFHKTVLQNTLADSVQTETTVRSVLARLLFTRNEVSKPAGVLSGGERIKLSMAKLLVSHNNVLMLDEPTNYLDMPSIEVLQSMLCDYEGTLLFVSHDRAFVNAVATALLRVENKKLYGFEGNLEDYEHQASREDNTQKMILEHKLAALAGEITRARAEDKQHLEAKYMQLLEELKRV